MTLEEQLRKEILLKYKSIRAFTTDIGVPYSTMDSVLKRGILNSGIGNVIKIFHSIGLDVESISSGVLAHKDFEEDTEHAATGLTPADLLVAHAYHDADDGTQASVRKLLDVGDTPEIDREVMSYRRELEDELQGEDAALASHDARMA